MIQKQFATGAEQLAALIDGANLRSNDKQSYRLVVTDLKPVRPRAGWFYLAINVADKKGTASLTPLAMGIVSGGGRLVMPWFELRVYPKVELTGGSELDARRLGLEAGLIDLIGELIPPGGHLMIEYESPGQSGTHAELLLRVPPAASYLGSLMFHAGFRGAFKDWYISEGGHEGPRKLQANKSPTPKTAREAREAHRAELTAFIRRELPGDPKDAAIVRAAQARARSILRSLAR
ncbi:MAG TPA: DUF1122 family protein [Candidatus Binataceae bacterium]|nr:DUF1122 family protein [Candidatus Binataceae bacterium]